MHIKLKKIILFFFFSQTLLLHAQTIPYEKYSTKDGLISDRITAIAQDEKGYLWFGSYFGVCRYDGQKFEKIELPAQQQNKYVTAVLPVKNKVYLSFSFQGGLAEYSNGRITVHLVEKNAYDKSEFFCMGEAWDNSIILCTGANEIYQFSNDRFKKLCTVAKETPGIIRSVVTDNEKNIWLGTEQGLYVLPFPYKKAMHFYPDNFFLSVTKDARGKIWFSRNDQKNIIVGNCAGYRDSNLSDEKIFYTSNLSKPSQFSGNLARGFWLAEGSNVLTNINFEGKIIHYKVSSDFNAEVKVLFVDREKNLWLSTEPGVLKFSNFSAYSFLFNELAFGGGSLTQQNDSCLWATNSVSLYSISNNGIEKINFAKPNDYLGSLHLDASKNLWIGYWDKGVSLLNLDKKKLIRHNYFSEFDHKLIKAQSFAEDSKGNLWIGGLNGIFRIKNEHVIEHFHPKNAAGHEAFIICMAVDEETKTMWVGDNDQGLIQLGYDERDGKFVYKVLRYVTTKNGLSDNYIRSILIDHKKNVWVGTRFGGIYKINVSGNAVSVNNCNAEAELACTRISQITEKDTSSIWFATCNGVYEYRFKENKWHHYNTSNGLLNAEVYSCEIDRKRKMIWALTAQGVTGLSLQSAETNVPPLINITAINVAGKPDTNAVLTGNKSYSSNKNSIEFEFAGISFIDEKQIRYRYMLDGYDKHWSGVVSNNNVSYASLPPGTYIFKVMAQNAKGQWSEKPATFEFEIVIPFYKRPWFIFLMITTMLFIVYFVYMQRLRHRYKIEKIRLNIARDLHDDVGSALGSINILSQTAIRRLQKAPVSEEITPIFEKIEQSAENTLDAMDDIVWSINPDKDKLQDLVIRMREFAIPLLEAKNIEMDFAVDGDEKQTIPMNLKRNLFLIYKESIHNVFKHSKASKVMIKLEVSSFQISMQIADNGNGFNTNVTSSRNGLKNMRHRAESVHASLEIHSSNEGTKLFFAAPIR